MTDRDPLPYASPDTRAPTDHAVRLAWGSVGCWLAAVLVSVVANVAGLPGAVPRTAFLALTAVGLVLGCIGAAMSRGDSFGAWIGVVLNGMVVAMAAWIRWALERFPY